MIDQEQLLNQINQKNPKGWKELYRSFYGALCSYSYTIVADLECAEDIVQESLIGMWKSDIHFSAFKALSVYLYRSVYHNSLKFIRDKHIYEGRLQKWLEEQDDPETLFLYYGIEEEMIRQLREAIYELPEQRRRIILLSMEGNSVQAIAEILNITTNTVKTQKKRAYILFKKRIAWKELLIPLLFIKNK